MDNNGQESVLETVQYQKSNFIISGKYKSSLLENKLMAISLSKLQYAEETSDSLVSRIKASELRELLKGNSGSFYQKLDEAARKMTGKTIGISNPEEKRFCYLAVVIMSKYENGEFIIEYNKHLKKYLCNIKQNFTILNLSLMLSINNGYGFRLYELLKSKAYYPKGYENRTKSETFLVKYSVAELKLLLGIVNAELDTVQRILRDKESPDYEKAVEVSPEKMFESWSEFRRKVLDVAIKEINDKTDIRVRYDTVKGGKGGKVYEVKFYVTLLCVKNITEPEENEDLSNIVDEDDAIDEIYRLLGNNIKSVRDARSIAKAAGNDLEKIRKAYRIYEAKEDVSNIVGFMIAAIEKDFSEPIKKKKKKNSFTDFEMNRQMSMEDIDELEKVLLERQMAIQDII